MKIDLYEVRPPGTGRDTPWADRSLSSSRRAATPEALLDELIERLTRFNLRQTAHTCASIRSNTTG